MTRLLQYLLRIACWLRGHVPGSKGVRWAHEPLSFSGTVGFPWRHTTRCSRCRSPMVTWHAEAPASVKARRKPAWAASVPTMADIRAEMKRVRDDALPMDPEHVLSGASEPLAPQQE